MFTRHDELRESEKALSCMAEYAMRCLKRKRVRVSSGVLTRFLKSERKLQVCFLKITTLSSSSSKITKSCNVPKFSRDNPPLSLPSSVAQLLRRSWKLRCREACREISPREEYSTRSSGSSNRPPPFILVRATTKDACIRAYRFV